MQSKGLMNQMGGIQSLARGLGVDEAKAAAGMAALLPAVLGDFKKQAATQPAGLDGLAAMLDPNKYGNPLDDVLTLAGKLLR